MPRDYWVDVAPAAVTVAADIVELTPADDKPIEVMSWYVLQTTDLGDAAEEIIGLLWVRGHTTSGSGGSAPTPRPTNPVDTAAGFTAETLNTTAASAGTGVNLPRTGWNVRMPEAGIMLPFSGPQASQGNTTMVHRMAAAPADSITVSGSYLVREYG